MPVQSLSGKNIAILVADGFEQIEMTSPRAAIENAGGNTAIVSLRSGQVQGWNHFDKADKFTVELLVAQARAEDFDGLLLPGGVANPDQLRADEAAVKFVRSFFDQHKPVAAICHAPWTLIEADAVAGRHLTSYRSIRTDLINAGANWEDKPAVTDRGLVTSRSPDDLPEFNKAMLENFASAPAAV